MLLAFLLVLRGGGGVSRLQLPRRGVKSSGRHCELLFVPVNAAPAIALFAVLLRVAVVVAAAVVAAVVAAEGGVGKEAWRISKGHTDFNTPISTY